MLPEWKTPFQKIAIGTGRLIQEGSELAILTLGHPGNFAVEACKALLADGIVPAHYDMRFAKPLDVPLLHQICKRFDKIITVEDGTIIGGFGSAILEFMAANTYACEVVMLGIPDRLVEHGKPEELQHECGFDAIGIAAAVRNMMSLAISQAKPALEIDRADKMN